MGKNLTHDARAITIDIDHARRARKRARDNETRPRDRNRRLIALYTEILGIYQLDEQEEIGGSAES